MLKPSSTELSNDESIWYIFFTYQLKATFSCEFISDGFLFGIRTNKCEYLSAELLSINPIYIIE